MKHSVSMYVALLRGINVGGNNKVSMKELKTCFEDAGYENVRTYINSGNVIFTHKGKESIKKITSHIEKQIKKDLGLEIRVIVRSKAQIVSLSKKISKKWTNDTKMRTDVIFLWNKVDNKESVSLIKTNPKVDTLMYTKGAVVWNFDRKNYTKSGMHKFIGTHVYKNMTARNINTLRKLEILMSDKEFLS